jgi:hypothetical protein
VFVEIGSEGCLAACRWALEKIAGELARIDVLGLGAENDRRGPRRRGEINGGLAR